MEVIHQAKNIYKLFGQILLDEASKDFYKEQDLENSAMVFYEVFDEAWLEFLQKLFWGMFRTSIDVASRVKELKMIE